MADFTLTLIKAIKARLDAQNVVAGDRVYSEIPQNPVYPYVWFKVSANEFDAKDLEGQDLEILFNVYALGSDTQSAVTQALTIRELIYNALHRQESNISLATGSLVMLHSNGNNDMLTENDGKTQIAVSMFRAIIN